MATLNSVWSVSISADCTRIASGSWDHTIPVGYSAGRVPLCHTARGLCRCVSFSPTDQQHLLSICNGKVWQWDINGHQVGPTYDGSHVAFSPDGTQFVSSYKGTVTVRNSSSGVVVTEFQMTDSNYIIAVSPLMVGLLQLPMMLPSMFGTLPAQNLTSLRSSLDIPASITSLVFSSPSSLISVSGDKSIKFWQIGVPSDSVKTDPKSASLASTEIRPITLQAKDGIIITSDSEGVVRVWEISTGLCKASFQTPYNHGTTIMHC
jgi:WD40 repeat protein